MSAMVGFGARGIEAGSKFALQVSVARILGPGGSGAVFMALTVVTLAATFGRIGLDRSLTFRIATTLASSDGEGLPVLIGTGMAICLMLSGALSLLVAMVAGPLATMVFHEPALIGPLRVLGFGITPMAMLAMVIGVLNGVGRAGLAQLIGSAMWPLLAAVLVLLPGTATGMAAMLLVALTTAAVSGLMALRRFVLLPTLRLNRAAWHALTEIGWPLCVVDTIQVTLISLPTIILGVFASLQDVGVFALCNRLSLIMTIVLMVMAGLGSSHMAAAHARRDVAALQRVMRHLIGIAMLCAAPALLLLAMVPQRVLLLFGPGFADGAPILRVLLVGQAVGIVFTCAPNVLEMTGNGWRLRRLNIAILAVNVAACFLLIPGSGPTSGAMGAALATSLTLVTYNVACGLMAWRYLGINASALSLLGMLPGRRRSQVAP
jgi:O-antigen/teichoic acid export membrane protein